MIAQISNNQPSKENEGFVPPEFLVDTTLCLLVDSYFIKLNKPCPRTEIPQYIETYLPGLYYDLKTLKDKLKQKKYPQEEVQFDKDKFQIICKQVFDALIANNTLPEIDVPSLSWTEGEALYKICVLLIGY